MRAHSALGESLGAQKITRIKPTQESFARLEIDTAVVARRPQRRTLRGLAYQQSSWTLPSPTPFNLTISRVLQRGYYLTSDLATWQSRSVMVVEINVV